MADAMKPPRGRAGGTVLPALAVLLLLAALAALVLPAAVAWADGGSVSLGAAAAGKVEAPAPGDAGTVGIGVEVGISEEAAPDSSSEGGRTVAIGAEVGYAGAPSAEHAVAFDAGSGAFPGGSSVLERVLADGARAQRPETDPERAGWLFLGWFQEGDPDPSWDAGGESKVPLGDEWDFSRRVQSDLALHAKWLRAAGSGSVSLGVEVADRVESPASGDAGSVLIGAEVGLKKEAAGGSAGEAGGTVPIGAEVGYALASQREATVTFDAGEGAFADGSPTSSASVLLGAAVAAPEDPRRLGWRFVAWHAAGEPQEGWDPTGASKAPLGDEWDFSRGIPNSMTLHARWELRLDVSLPVEVGFAVDAESHKVTTPDAGLYAVKSRTAQEVRVEEVAVLSPQGELDAFFDLAEGPADEQDREDAWHSALRGTKLWVWRTGPGGVSEWGTDFSKEPAEGDASFALALANEEGSKGGYVHINPDGTPGETVSGWRNAVSLSGSSSFTLAAFEGGASDPSVSLPLKLGMGISDELVVETALDGPKPLTHIIVTVSARQ